MALNELIEEVSSNGYVLGLRCEKFACLLVKKLSYNEWCLICYAIILIFSDSEW